MGFPFPVPEDLTKITDDELAELATKAREYAQTIVADDTATVEGLTAARDLFNNVTTEQTNRAAAAEAATKARAELSAQLTPPANPAPTDPAPADPAPTPPADPAPADPAPVAPTPAAVTASTGRRSTLDDPPPATAERHVIMTASSDTTGAGTELPDFKAATRLIGDRLSTYSSSTRTNRAARRVGRHTFALNGRTLTRHGNVAFRRQFPDALRITNQSDAMEVIEYATSEKRLPGGNLRESARKLVEAGRSLTAAVGWCAASEVMYDLCELEAIDGILDIPEVQAPRGGFFLPADGGPDFSTIFNGIGDSGDVILSEYDIENDAVKVCTEIPCPEFEEVRLDVAYVCLTGSLLQQRGYPEAVARFSRGSMVALAHKVNASVIARIAAASGAATTVPTIFGSDDAASQLLSAVELAIEDTKYRTRMPRGSTVEVPLPAWVIAPIRAALARRRGVLAINVSDAEILEAFTVRKAIPRFVLDWQDAYSGLVGGPGGATPITAFPDEVQFMVYPSGTWSKIVRDVVNLDTVYDNALLTRNQYTAMFAEDGFNVIQTCPESRLYQVGIDPAGIVGCCEYTS
jgi:hypothetical protein